MAKRHRLDVPADALAVYAAWAAAYPPDGWELDRNNRLQRAMLDGRPAPDP